jgi:hypothetical protein
VTLDDMLRRLRGAFGNAVVWGAVWFTVSFVVAALLLVLGVISPGDSIWMALLSLPIRLGVLGFGAGGAFSLVISLLYGGRRLSEISWVRFGIGGGLATALFMPPFLQLLNILSGTRPIPWRLVLDDTPLMLLLGGVAAATTLRLAQYAERLRLGGSADRLEETEDGDRLMSGGTRILSARESSPSRPETPGP